MLSSLNGVIAEVKDRVLFDAPNPYKIDDCYLGYDAMQPMSQGDMADVLDGVTALAKATNSMSKSPVINVLNGLVSDGGYAACMGRYVVATLNARFQIANPSRGLSFDPVGFSYILPRLGKDYNQSSAKYPVGKILALTGYVANGEDMVATGLATHYGNWQDLAMLEQTLAQISPYEQQVQDTVERTKKFKQYALPENKYYDAAVANALDAFMAGNAAIRDLGSLGDASLGEYRESHLVDYAATFQEIFAEDSVEGILDGLKEATSKEGADEDYKTVKKFQCPSIIITIPFAFVNVVSNAFCQFNRHLLFENSKRHVREMEIRSTIILDHLEEKHSIFKLVIHNPFKFKLI